MARTEAGGDQILDGSIGIDDLNTTDPAIAVATRVLPGDGIDVENTGAGTGTGEVTVHNKLLRDIQDQNTILAGPATSGPGVPAFRPITWNDIPAPEVFNYGLLYSNLNPLQAQPGAGLGFMGNITVEGNASFGYIEMNTGSGTLGAELGTFSLPTGIAYPNKVVPIFQHVNRDLTYLGIFVQENTGGIVIERQFKLECTNPGALSNGEVIKLYYHIGGY